MHAESENGKRELIHYLVMCKSLNTAATNLSTLVHKWPEHAAGAAGAGPGGGGWWRCPFIAAGSRPFHHIGGEAGKFSAQLFSRGPWLSTTLAAKAQSERFIAVATAGSSRTRSWASASSTLRL